MQYPSNCVRGVSNPQDVTPEGVPLMGAFNFAGADRGDGWIELSVSWDDDGTVVSFTLSQTKDDGELQFRGGAITLPRSEVDRLNTDTPLRGLLSYERAPIDTNRYHGNILLRSNTEPAVKRLVAANLASASGVEVHARN